MLRVTTETTSPTGGPYYTTMYFEGQDQAAATAAANAVRTFWDQCKAVIGGGTSMNVNDEIEVVDPATGQVTGTFPAVTAPVAGTAAGDHLPPFTQGLVRWLTGTYVNGRQLRGRTFIPNPVEGNHTAGAPDGPYTATVTTAANNLLGTTDFGIYSPTHRVFNLGAAASVWTKWALLRSRRD